MSTLITLGCFFFFTSLVGLLTYWITHSEDVASSDGYFLAGRSLKGGVIAGSLLLTNLSTEQLVGLNGAAFRDGICVMAWEVVAAIGLVTMAWYFLPRYLKSGIATVPQFLEERFGPSTRAITSYIFISAYALILLPILLYTGARGLSDMLDVASLTNIPNDATNLWLMIWMIGIIGSIYAIFGGLRSVAVSDTLNGFGLLVGGVLITYFGLRVVGDGSLVEGWRSIREAHPEKFNSLGRADQSVPFGTLFTGVLLLNLFYWCTNQQIIQRTLAAHGLREGQKGVLLAGSFKLLAPLILVIPGIIAFHRYGTVEEGGQEYKVQATSRGDVTLVLEAEDGDMSLLSEADLKIPELTLDVARQQVGSPLAIDDQSYTVRHAVPPGVVIATASDGTWNLLPNADARQTVGFLQSDKAYGTLVRDVLPEYLVGFFAAVVVGAVLSSFNSALNSTATLFSLGVYKTQMRPQAAQSDVIRAGKWFGLLVAIFAMSTAPQLRQYPTIFTYLQDMNGLYFIPLFTIVLLGMLTRRTSALAANITALVGLAVIAVGYWIVPIFVPDFFDRCHKFHFLGVVFVALCALMLILGAIWPRDTAYQQQHSGDVDVTWWPWTIPFGLMLFGIVTSVYTYFADWSTLGS